MHILGPDPTFVLQAKSMVWVEDRAEVQHERAAVSLPPHTEK